MSLSTKSKLEELLQSKPEIINIGVREFAETVIDQTAKVVHVEWSPPAGGDPEMMELLEGLI